MGLGWLTGISLKQSNSCNNIINPLLVRSTQKGYQLERERCYGVTSLVRPDLKWDPYSTHSWVQYFKNTILCLDFTSHPLDNINAISIFGLNWSLPSQKLQKHHPKAVDITFLIDFQCVCIFCKYPKTDLVLRKKKRRKEKRHFEYSIYITFAFEVLLNRKPFVCSALNPKPY